MNSSLVSLTGSVCSTCDALNLVHELDAKGAALTVLERPFDQGPHGLRSW